MNIFALDPDPAIAAAMHCDQHLHKMILESAQMLSTMFHKNFPEETRLRKLVYKSAYENHPCTQWVCKSINNAAWLIKLCYELQDIRYSLGGEEHSSLEIIKRIDVVIDADSGFVPNNPENFIFAGPDQFRLRPDLDIHQKYQRYYIHKYQLWLGSKHPMSYKNRQLPEFLSEYSDKIVHGV